MTNIALVLTGVQPEDSMQGPALSFFEKRNRMVSQPTAVQMGARLLAIRQVANCC